MLKVLSSILLTAALIFTLSLDLSAQKTKKKVEPAPPPVAQGPKETIKPEINTKFCLKRDDYIRFAFEVGAKSVFGGSTSDGNRIFVSLLGDDGMLIVRKDDQDIFCLVYILHNFKMNYDVIINLFKSGQEHM